jgi:nitric oxide reductase NorD protein
MIGKNGEQAEDHRHREGLSLVVLASALSLIGDDFGIFSYFSLGRHKVFSNVVKDFFEPWDARTQGRLSSIQAYASNRDGCAIRHAVARLADHPHRTKLLLILSDGIPADVGYGSASSADTSEYAIEDTRRSILECLMKGIVPYCITINKSARSYISHIYGDYHYTVIDDVSALPHRLSRLYLRLTQ